MSYRSIFGDDLSEHDLEIIIDSGIARAEWDSITRRAEQYSQRYGPQRTIRFVGNLLRGAGVAAAAIAALSKAAVTRPRENQQEGKRLREANDAGPPHKIPRDDDSEEPAPRDDIVPKSLPNLTAEEQASKMPEGTGSGNDAGLSETPIDEITSIHRGPPNYTFASLPWYYDRQDYVTNTSTHGWTFRMTSPYDVSVTGTIQDDNVGAGENKNVVMATAEPDGSAQSARWFDFYKSIYKFYHVISCRWHLSIENMATEPIWVHTYYSNEVDRPRLATNRDILMWPDVKSHYVGAAANAILSTGLTETGHANPSAENAETGGALAGAINFEDGNLVTPRGPSNILVTSGTYKPGDYKRDIRLDSEVENWTSVTTNPALSERFSFRVKPQWDAQNLAAGDANNYGRTLNYRWVFKCEYLVEFKELQDGIKYPIQDQPLTITINQLQGVK